jgi:hypothetical protein
MLECQKKVVDELSRIFSERQNSAEISEDGVRIPTYDELQQMDYLGMVLKETLRYIENILCNVP